MTVLNDNQSVKDVLVDNEEVFFELVSSDIWLQVIFQMKEQDDIITCGVTEFKMDKSDTLDCLKKKV